MKTIQLLTMIFDTSIRLEEIKTFRSAVLKKAGLQYELYHYTSNSTHPYSYGYPLIQYKRLYRRPAIVFIEQGVEASEHLFVEPRLKIPMNSKNKPLKICSTQFEEYQFGVDPGQWHYYALSGWMALNSNNYRKYLTLKTFDEQINLLNRILASHIVAFAKHIGHHLECRFEIQIQEFKENTTSFEGFEVLTFNLHFRTQVLLPPSIGLGKAVGIGYGVLRYWQPDHLDSTITNQQNSQQ